MLRAFRHNGGRGGLISGFAGRQRGSVGCGRNGQPRVSQLGSAPQPDPGTIWDSEGRHMSLEARFRLGDGRLGEVRRAADTPAGFAGRRGKFTAFALEADIPALLR